MITGLVVALGLCLLMIPVLAPAAPEATAPAFSDLGPAGFLTVAVNQATFVPGSTLVISVSVNNPGLAPTVDFYVGIITPDGVTLVSLTNSGIAFGTLSDLTTLSPVATGIPLANPFAVSAPTFFSHTWTGAEPSGIYTVFVAVLTAGALTDGALTTSELFAASFATFTFSANRQPIAVDDTASTTVDTPVTIAVLANDSDPDGDPLTVTGVTPGAHGAVATTPNGSLTYTPAAGFTGVDHFT
jgi:Bacterial Ig domain